MSAITFDMLQFVQRLKKAGIKEPEVEAVRDVQASAELATKQDIANLEVKIAETKSELIKWVVSVGVLQSALIGALLLKPIPG